MMGMSPFLQDKTWVVGIGFFTVVAGLSINYAGYHQLREDIEDLREKLDKKTPRRSDINLA